MFEYVNEWTLKKNNIEYKIHFYKKGKFILIEGVLTPLSEIEIDLESIIKYNKGAE